MSNVTINVSAYSGKYAELNGTFNIKITKMDIARGIVSIGKTREQLRINHALTENDLTHYVTGLNFYIDEHPNLCLTPLFLGLDGSDKNGKSYNIGMGIARIVGERYLKLRYVQNLDKMLRKGIVELSGKTKERGDLIGLDTNGKWHVLEAKGRSNRPSKKDRTKAKNQAERITKIDGIKPETKSYCLTHISSNGCIVDLVDPDDQPLNPISLKIDKDKFIKSYYDELFGTFYDTEPFPMAFVDSRYFTHYSFFEIPKTDFWIGIPETYFNDLKNGSIDFINDTAEVDNLVNSINDPYNSSVGIDGIMIFNRNRS